ncbi:MAG TPA: ABATE domain-containing protein, partial [Rhodanobacteraceae bacterium]
MDLVAVCALRDATDALLRARLERVLAPDSMVRRFNRALAAPSAQTRLEWTGAGPRKSLPAASAQRDTLIRALALDALEILTGPQAGLLRKCAHPACR